MKRVTLTYRKVVNHLQQEGRVVTAMHTMALDDKGTIVHEHVECDFVDVAEFCVQMKWSGKTKIGSIVKTRAIPLDLIYNIEIEEV